MNLDTQIKTTLTFEEARAASLSFRTVTLDRAQLNVQLAEFLGETVALVALVVRAS